MRKYQIPVFAIILFSFILAGDGNAIAQQRTVERKKIAIRKFTGFSEFLTIDKFIQHLNILNDDKTIVYVRYVEDMRTDFIVDVKSDNSFPKKMIKQSNCTSADIKYSEAVLNSADTDYPEDTRGVRTIGVYYDNEYSLYDDEDSETGFGSAILTVSQPGLNRKPSFKKVIYLEDANLLIEERLFDELVNNMFTFFQKTGDIKTSPY